MAKPPPTKDEIIEALRAQVAGLMAHVKDADRRVDASAEYDLRTREQAERATRRHTQERTALEAEVKELKARIQALEEERARPSSAG